MKMVTKRLTQSAMIAGLYAAITFATFFMSFGAVQYRVSEALTVLPVFTVSAVPGLSVGCAVANLLGFFIGANPVGALDALFGTAATLIAAIATYYTGKVKKRWVRYLFAPLWPVLANAVVVGLEICVFFEGSLTPELFFINAGLVGLGELVVCYGLGIPLMLALERRNLWKRLFREEK